MRLAITRSRMASASVMVSPGGFALGGLATQKAELLHHRLVGDAEENGAARGAMGMRVPGRHDEHVAAAPSEALVFDLRLALAVDHGVDIVGGRLVRLGTGLGLQAHHV